MRRLRTLICLPLLALPLSAAGTLTAHADSLGDAGTAQCTASGFLSTNLGQLPETVTFTGALTLSCVGVGDDAGTWSLTMTGQMSPGFCAGGQGLASIGGSGPDGGVSAGLELTSSATSLHMEGTLATSDPGGDAFEATLGMTPTSGIPCVNAVTRENLSGHASITDLSPPPDEVACTVNGTEDYAPGITAAPATLAVNGGANLSCTNPISDDRGGWALNYSGSIFGDCGVTEGTVGFGASGPDVSSSGSANYERVGTLLQIEGSSTDMSFAIWVEVTPSSNCATFPWNVSGYTGGGGIVE